MYGMGYASPMDPDADMVAAVERQNMNANANSGGMDPVQANASQMVQQANEQAAADQAGSQGSSGSKIKPWMWVAGAVGLYLLLK